MRVLVQFAENLFDRRLPVLLPRHTLITAFNINFAILFYTKWKTGPQFLHPRQQVLGDRALLELGLRHNLALRLHPAEKADPLLLRHGRGIHECGWCRLARKRRIGVDLRSRERAARDQSLPASRIR